MLTVLIELGLGLIAYLGCVIIAPQLKSIASKEITKERTFITSSNPLIWIVQPWRFEFGWNHEKTVINKKPLHMKTWVLWESAQYGLFMLAELIPTVILLTSVGWELPFQNHLYYNLVFATANGAPNGAHITSYLSVMFLVLFSAWKSKDVIFGVLAGAFLVAFHEGFWLIFYFAGYAQYFSMLMITNILKDVLAFIPMIILFAIAYWKYPFRLGQMKSFIPLIVVYLSFLTLWFFIPHLISPYYGFLPIRTANIPYNVSHGITFTIYNETKYFWNPIISIIEEVSWIMCALGIGVIIGKSKKV